MPTKTKPRRKKKRAGTNNRVPRKPSVFLTQPELVDALAVETGFTKEQSKIFLTSLADVITDTIGNARGVKIAGIVQVNPAIRPPQKARMGRNPQTGEDVKIPKKPAMPVLRARALKKAKDALPTVQKIRAYSG